MKEKFEIWKEHWDELSDSTKISIRNEYCMEHNVDEELFSFDEEFFEMFFSNANAIEVARAVFFGNIKNWCDEYIKFNGYGNLESMSVWDAVEDTENYYLKEIFENEDCWRDEIDEDDINSEYCFQHWEYIKGEVELELPDIAPELIDQWLEDNWDEDENDDYLVKQCIEYLKDPENL